VNREIETLPPGVQPVWTVYQLNEDGRIILNKEGQTYSDPQRAVDDKGIFEEIKMEYVIQIGTSFYRIDPAPVDVDQQNEKRRLALVDQALSKLTAEERKALGV
jgi:hypothetical protein